MTGPTVVRFETETLAEKGRRLNREIRNAAASLRRATEEASDQSQIESAALRLRSLRLEQAMMPAVERPFTLPMALTHGRK